VYLSTARAVSQREYQESSFLRADQSGNKMTAYNHGGTSLNILPLLTSTQANVTVLIIWGSSSSPYHDSIVSSHWFRNSHICRITGSDIAIGLDPETVPHNTVDPNSVFSKFG
jgi:hypothetical protein